MKISYNWLQEYLSPLDQPELLGQKLTNCGLEVEKIERYEAIKGSLEGVVIGEVLTCEKHPEADKLKLTTVDIGQVEPLHIVCGAPNVDKGQKVAVALVGSTIYPISGDSITLKKAKIRGALSEGMICAEDEIGVGKSHDGIMILDTDLPNGTPAIEYFKPYHDFSFEIGLTPNRADGASHYGVARDIKAVNDTEINLKEYKLAFKKESTSSIQIVIENQKDCPRYSGLLIENVTVTDSPEWLKNKLRVIGINPINNIVDITNFILHDLGQPLHAFDADKIIGNTVVVKNVEKDTVFITLDGQERKLSASDLMICNAKEAMCIAGVFGGLDSGITKETKNIFLESAYFSADSIRKTSLFHGLKTDASFRFERGTDPNMTIVALKKATYYIQQITGADAASDIVDIYPDPVENTVFKVKFSKIERLLGKKIEKSIIFGILEKLDIRIIEKREEDFMVSVPPYRVDVTGEADIAEEILRIYGFNNIEIDDHLGTEFLADFPSKDIYKLQQKTSQLLASQGFFEIFTNSLTKEDYLSLSKDFDIDKSVHILNYLSQDLNVMRQTALFSGLEAIGHNINRKQKNVKFFEFGKIYSLLDTDKQKTVLQRFKEENVLSLWVSGNEKASTWQVKDKKNTFHSIAQSIESIFEKNNVQISSTQAGKSDIYAYSLEYMHKQKVIAQVGLIKSSICKALDIKQEVFYAKIDWDYIANVKSQPFVFQDIAKFPEVVRDLSIIVNESITYQELKDLVLKTERKLIKNVNVFDVYQDDKLGANQKAYALSFILQDEQQTLTDKVIDKTMNRLIQVFEQELKATIRR